MASMEADNKVVFVVRREATKPMIKHAAQVLFEAEVHSVQTKISPDGEKHATVRFKPGTKAEDIGMRVGIF